MLSLDYDQIVNKDDTETITGTCYSMCPPEEADLREKEKLVHVLEVLGSSRKLVKCYSRSAADSTLAVPSLLRPYTVLRDTVKYLLYDVTSRDGVSTLCIFNFVNDRLRSVRQDMTIQRLPPAQCTSLLEPMIRFYVYYGYKLCGCSPNDFDSVLNKKYLLECMKWYLHSCDLISLAQSDKLISKMSALTISDGEMEHSRPLVESLYILCNLHDVHPLYRYLSLPRELKRSDMLNVSFRIAVANMSNNYVQVTKLMTMLCPLTYYAVQLYLPVLQKRALQVLSVAYSARFPVPLEAVARWLGLRSEAQARELCRHYGLAAEADVRCSKDGFKDAPPIRIEQIPSSLSFRDILKHTSTSRTS